ncbi:MAG: Rrf2 family transcriptional regulator [Planctomycetota bacterium]
MLRLSKRTEHGLRAAVQLARLASDTYVQSRDLAAAEDLPTKFLESILLLLRRGGVLESKVGSGGGYKLTRPANDIRVGELIRLLENQEDAAPANAPTSVGGRAVALLHQKLDDAAGDALDAMTLADLVQEASVTGEAMWFI